MNIYCPSCGYKFLMKSDTEYLICPNTDCHAPYRFRLFDCQMKASDYYRNIKSWKAKYLFEIQNPINLGISRFFIVAYFNDPIQPYMARSFSSLIDKNILRSIQAGAADNLGGPITLIEIEKNHDNSFVLKRIEPLEYSARRANDNSEQPNAPSHMRLFTDFCKTLRSAKTISECGDEICLAFDRDKTMEFISNPPYTPSWHICWCGLVDYIVPLIVHGEIVGVLFSGQKRMGGSEFVEKMTNRIREACIRLNLEQNNMIQLAFKEDVDIVDQELINRDLDRLKGIADRLIKQAEEKYAIECQLRESHLLEEIGYIFTELAAQDFKSEIDLWVQIGKILMRIQDFTGCFKSIALLKENSLDSGVFKLVSSKGPINNAFTKEIPETYYDELMPDRLGPLMISQGNRSLLYESLSGILVPYKIEFGYVIRMKLKTGLNLLLILAVDKHNCRFNAVDGFCHQISQLGRRFLTQLGNTLSKEFDALLYLNYLKRVEKSKDAFLTRAAHSLSIPMQSIIIDSDNLLSEIDSGVELHDIAQHNFNEVQGLQLVVENILHESEEDIIHDNTDYYTRSKKLGFSKCSLFDTLKKACDMFTGEAKEKGCDIITSVTVDGSVAKLLPSELDDLFLIYKQVFFEPLGNNHSIELRKLIGSSSNIRIKLEKQGTELRCGPRQLIDECFNITQKYGHDESIKIFISVSDKTIELPISLIVRKYLPEIEAIPKELALAFKNLVHNAVKYSFRSVSSGVKRYVEIAISIVNNKYYKVDISNFGTGITDHEIKEGLIWKPKYRGVLSGDRNRTGSGLGLSHVKKSIEKIHGGKIEVQSIRKYGTAYLSIFTVTLPFLQSDRIYKHEDSIEDA